MKQAGFIGRRGFRLRENVATQEGQALLEALVALMALLALAWAVAWLGRLQDMALQAEHAARHVAFLGASQAEDDLPKAVQGAFFDGRHHRWQDEQGQSWLPQGGQGLEVSLQRTHVLPAWAQPANRHAQGDVLRQDWQVADDGVLHAQVRLQPETAQGPAMPVIVRQAFILQGAGHAGSDVQTQQRVAQAAVPWAQTAQRSYRLSNTVAGRMRAVDKAWARADPEEEWLTCWQGFVPDWHTDHSMQASGTEQVPGTQSMSVRQP